MTTPSSEKLQASSTVPTILVTGATGKVGCAVIRTLLSDHFPPGSFRVRAAAHDTNKLQDCKQKHPQLEVVEFDFNDKSTYSRALQGVTTAFLLTTYTVDMIVHSKLFIDAAKEAGVQFMVHNGVDVPDDEPLKPGVWHAMIERYIEVKGFQGWTHLHPVFYMENLTSYGGVPLVQNKEIRTPFKPEAKLTWITTDDIGCFAAHVLANPSAHKSKVYPLAADEASHADVATLLSKLTHDKYTARQVDIKEWYNFVLQHGQIEASYLSGFCEVVEWVNRGEAKGSPVNCEMIKAVCGCEPMRLEQWLTKHVEDVTGSAKGGIKS